MFVIGGVVIGVIIGVLRARARGGKAADMAQYAAAHAILLGLIGLGVTIAVDRLFLS